MKMVKGPPTFQPISRVKCTVCESVMEDVQFNDLKRKHHPAASNDQRDGPWDEVYIDCMGCKRMIMITGIHSYLVAQISTS